jgi:hypothetical protein
VLKRGALLAMLGAAVVLGCGGGDDEKKQTKPADTRAPTATTTTTPSGQKVEVPDEAIASRDGSISGNAVKLELLQLKRSGETSALTIRLSGLGSSEVQVGEALDDGVEQKVEGSDVSDSPVGITSMDGITLIDTQNRKRYLVGRDSKGICACDNGLGGNFVSADAPVVLSATYAAPPDDVDAMDVLVPGFGTFKDVPIS